MKIVEDTDTRLVIEDRPWVLGLTLIGFCLIAIYGLFETVAEGDWAVTAILVGMAGIIYWVLNRHIQFGRLVLDKAAAQASWSTRSALKSKTETHQLDDLRRAVIETHYDDGATHRVTLLFDSKRGPLPLTPYFSGLGSPKDIKVRINTFLGAPDPDLDHR